MGRRVQEQQQKAKERQELEKEVGKMLVYDNQLKTPVYQKQLEDYATKGVSEIIEKMNNGDDDTRASAYKWLQNFKNFNAKISAADAEAQETFKAIAKDPNSYAWQDRQVIDGKEYGSLMEVLNDPKFADPEAMKSALQRFGGTDIQAVEGKTPSDPSVLVRWNPGQVADPIEVAIEDAKLRNQYDDYRVGKPFMFGDKRVAETAYGMNPNTVNAIVEESFMQKPVLRYYEELLYKNRPDKDMTRVEFSQTDWMSEAKRMHEQNVRPRIQSMVVGQGKIEDTLTAPKAEKPTLFNKHYTVSDVGVTNENGKRITFNAISNSQGVVPINIPSDAKQQDSDGNWVQASKKGTVEASPVGVQFNGGRLEFLLSRKGKEGSTTLYAVPASQDIFNSVASGLYLTDPEEKKEVLFGSIQKVIEGQPEKIRDEYLNMLGLSGPKSPKGSAYTIKGRTYSLEDLKSMGYTEEQVSQYKNK
jgi:hypothetical protein